jgi:hypothetical protein
VTDLAVPLGEFEGANAGPRERRTAGVVALARRLLSLRLLGWQPSDVLSRIVVGALFLMLAMRVASNWRQTGHVTGLLLLASEALVVVLMIVRRPTGDVDRRFIARAMTLLSMAGPPLVRPVAAGVDLSSRLGGALPGDNVTAAFSAVGLALVIAAKITLGRSFGMVPANRGVVSSGPYRLVRHPIYLGYVITHVAFVLANPVLWNLLVLAAADIALVVRSRYEEETLQRDARYVEYAARVRWHLVPGVF